MLIGFIIWTAVAALLLAIAVRVRKSEKAAGFYTGVTPPEVRDVRKYNRAVSALWFACAALFELLGLPLILPEPYSAGFLWSIPGTAVITIGLMIAYNRILARHRK